jgi:hypothetical protein
VFGGGDNTVDEPIHVDGASEEAAEVAVVLLVIGVQRNVVDRVVGLFLPRAVQFVPT